MPKSILITGSNGQLGNELQLLANDDFQFIFTNKDTLDITKSGELRQFFREHKIDFCINTAAYTKVDLAETETETCQRVNIEGCFNLAEICDQYDTKLIHISTDFVFDGERHTPYDEQAYPNPLSVYGKTKKEGEQAVLDELEDAIVVRTSWVYSRFGGNFVKTMLRLAESKTEISVVEDQIGSPTYAKDLAIALLTIIRSRWVPGIYHFSNDGVASWYDFAHSIFEIRGLDLSLLPIKTAEYKTQAQRPLYSVLDKSKIKKTYKIITRHWRDALREMLLEDFNQSK